jgi:hypothetical protein
VIRSHRIKTLALGVACLTLGTVAGVAYAANERYDLAKDNIAKAIALLKAIENPTEPTAEKIQRQLAIKQLESADQHIDKAKAAADEAAAARKKTKKDSHGKKGHKDHNDHKN